MNIIDITSTLHIRWTLNNLNIILDYLKRIRQNNALQLSGVPTVFIVNKYKPIILIHLLEKIGRAFAVENSSREVISYLLGKYNNMETLLLTSHGNNPDFGFILKGHGSNVSIVNFSDHFTDNAKFYPLDSIADEINYIMGNETTQYPLDV